MRTPDSIRRLGHRLRRSPHREDESALREAYAAHGSELFGIAYRSLGDRGLAEEVVQETFVRAWRSRERFEAERGSVRTWLFSITRNLIIDAARRKSVRPQGPVSEERREKNSTHRASTGGQAADDPITEDPAERILTSLHVEEALRLLSEDHRRVIFEVYYRGRLYAEVAEELGVPAGTLRSRMYYALKALRLTLEETETLDER
jgi:RNA polymerase sigma-70 factor (ECF subfamily)